MKTFIRLLIFLFIAAVVAVFAYMDYAAYKQRFPDAEPWTYFFQK
jgi:hypothetical protein